MGHHHSFGNGSRKIRALCLAALIAGVGGFIELYVGWRRADSYALVADALHMFGHGGAYLLGIVVALAARRVPERAVRIEAVGAILSMAALLVLMLFVVVPEAFARVRNPRMVAEGWMFWTAVFGLLANVVQKKLLEEGARHDLNIRGVYMHVLTDYLNSVLTVGAAILIWTRGMFVADAVAAFAVVAFMAVVGCTVVIEAVKVSRSSYR